jgi:hypothetical protein
MKQLTRSVWCGGLQRLYLRLACSQTIAAAHEHTTTMNTLSLCHRLAWAALLVTGACTRPSEPVAKADLVKLNLTQYVNPYIGSGFHGHVFVGANVPFGAVQLGPTQLTEGWDWCSGYHHSDSVIVAPVLVILEMYS